MKIDERLVGNVTILDVSGQIKLGLEGVTLKDKIHSIVNQGNKNIVVNLGQVDYVDSSGLGDLVGAHTTVSRAGGTMKLLNLTKKMRDLLSITKLLTVFESFDSEQDAVKSFT